MTPKEKADEIFKKMYKVDEIIDDYPIYFNTAKQCALIAVDEMIGYLEKDGFSTQIEYWKEVKQEIQNL